MMALEGYTGRHYVGFVQIKILQVQRPLDQLQRIRTRLPSRKVILRSSRQLLVACSSNINIRKKCASWASSSPNCASVRTSEDASLESVGTNEQHLKRLPSLLAFLAILCSCNSHQDFFVLDRDPTGQYLHGVLEVGVQDDLPGRINQGRAGRMQNVKVRG